jgi:hypothetical protein
MSNQHGAGFCYVRYKYTAVVLRIRICFSVDQDPAFYLNADQDPESQTNANPDSGQDMPSQKVGLLNEKFTL